MTGPFNPSGHATDEEKNTVSKIFNFNENDNNLAENTKFLAKSSFDSSANIDLLTTKDGALQS